MSAAATAAASTTDAPTQTADVVPWVKETPER
jgi:hypothetical protein